MRCTRPGLLFLGGLSGLAVLSYLVLVAGCGSGTPSNFSAAPDAQVDPDLAAAVAAWVGAQEAGDQDALEALYDPNYAFNGMSAEEMAGVRVLPETPDTRVDTIRHRFIPGKSPDHHHAEDHPHHIVRARVTATGVVAADYIRHLASGEPAGHTHEHGDGAANDQPLPGTVRAKATYDIEWEFNEENGGLLIVRQQTIMGELSLGSGVSNPLLDEVHVHPSDPVAGEPVEVHGHYAALPPGGLVQVSIGAHQADAVLDSGQFDADIEAPHHAGEFVARVEAFGGSAPSRTAALTVVEQEVTVQ